MALNYSRIKISEKLHVTWNYGSLIYPEGVKRGDKVSVTIIGEYNDKDVDCFIVKVGDFSHQPSGTLLHITTDTRNDAKPVESGKRATFFGFKPVKHYSIEGIWE